MSKAWTKDIPWVDPHTFGGTRACETLADMLNQNVVSAYEKHKIIAFINKITSRFKAALDIRNPRIRSYILSILREDAIIQIDKMVYPEKINTYIKNIVSHHYRRNLEQVNHRSRRDMMYI